MLARQREFNLYFTSVVFQSLTDWPRLGSRFFVPCDYKQIIINNFKTDGPDGI